MRWILLVIVAAFVPFTHAQSDKKAPLDARISRARSTGQADLVADRHLRGQISGAVINEYGTPIDKARVWIDVAASNNFDNSISLRRRPIPGKTQFAVTDENGRFELRG